MFNIIFAINIIIIVISILIIIIIIIIITIISGVQWDNGPLPLLPL